MDREAGTEFAGKNVLDLARSENVQTLYLNFVCLIEDDSEAVSYTHLTLPTIYSV